MYFRTMKPVPAARKIALQKYFTARFRCFPPTEDAARIARIPAVEEYHFANPWNTVLLEIINNRDWKNDPELLGLNVIRKLETIGCSDKESAWSIAQFTARCLNQQFFPEVIAEFHSKSCYRILLPRSATLFFKFLLNYGFVESIDVERELCRLEVKKTICLCFLSLPEMFEHGLDIAGNVYEQIDVLNQLRSAKERSVDGPFQKGLKRLMLTLKCIPMLEEDYRESNTAEDYAQCLRLYFRGISDPFVQADEVREFITFFLGENSKESVEPLVSLFKKLFPESVAPYGPRSLRHLCRCQVRDTLSRKSEVMPELLNSLRIPNRLKVYLLGDS